MSKEIILKNLNEIQELVNDDKKFKYKSIVNFNCEHIKEELESIDNAEPSEALECLEKIGAEKLARGELIRNDNKLEPYIATIKQALLKAQEPKKYLKWEDLEFKEETQKMKVKMGDNIYDLYYLNAFGSNHCGIGGFTFNETSQKDVQLFNDLRLERVEK